MLSRRGLVVLFVAALFCFWYFLAPIFLQSVSDVRPPVSRDATVTTPPPRPQAVGDGEVVAPVTVPSLRAQPAQPAGNAAMQEPHGSGGRCHGFARLDAQVVDSVLDLPPQPGVDRFKWKAPTSPEKYKEYVEHQKAKLNKKYKTVIHYDAVVEQMTRAMLTRHERAGRVRLQGSRVLCGGARLGGEVRAFKELGAAAVGIDLNPGVENHHVMDGDLHNLAFADGSVDIIFTNVIDHILDLDRFLSEVKRICAPGCQLMTPLYDQSRDAKGSSHYEVQFWDGPAFLLNKTKGLGFRPQANIYTSINLPPPAPVKSFWDVLLQLDEGSATGQPVGEPCRPIHKDSLPLAPAAVQGTERKPIVLQPAPAVGRRWPLPISLDRFKQALSQMEQHTDRVEDGQVDQDIEATTRAVLQRHLQGGHLRLQGARALCIGSRFGGDVRGLKSLGAFAVGTDADPGYGNVHVVYGGSENLAFPDASMDVLYIATPVKAPDVAVFTREAARVCSPGCLFLAVLPQDPGPAALEEGLRAAGFQLGAKQLVRVGASQVVWDLLYWHS